MNDIFSSPTTSWNADRSRQPAGKDEQRDVSFIWTPAGWDEWNQWPGLVLIDRTDFVPEPLLTQCLLFSPHFLQNIRTSFYNLMSSICNVWPTSDDSARSCQLVRRHLGIDRLLCFFLYFGPNPFTQQDSLQMSSVLDPSAAVLPTRRLSVTLIVHLWLILWLSITGRPGWKHRPSRIYISGTSLKQTFPLAAIVVHT